LNIHFSASAARRQIMLTHLQNRLVHAGTAGYDLDDVGLGQAFVAGERGRHASIFDNTDADLP
jgi:hypothetical protein